MEDKEESGGDGPKSGPGHHGMGKGLSREQNEGLDMVKHIMLSLDEDDGLDQIYTFRLLSIFNQVMQRISYALLIFLL